jgi:hypothetical protein
MSSALARHDELVRAMVVERGGHVSTWRRSDSPTRDSGHGEPRSELTVRAVPRCLTHPTTRESVLVKIGRKRSDPPRQRAEVLDVPGLRWDGGAPMPMLIATEYVTMFARELPEPNDYLQLPDDSVVVAAFEHCTSIRFGLPNEDMVYAHPSVAALLPHVSRLEHGSDRTWPRRHRHVRVDGGCRRSDAPHGARDLMRAGRRHSMPWNLPTNLRSTRSTAGSSVSATANSRSAPLTALRAR